MGIRCKCGKLKLKQKTKGNKANLPPWHIEEKDLNIDRI